MSNNQIIDIGLAFNLLPYQINLLKEYVETEINKCNTIKTSQASLRTKRFLNSLINAILKQLKQNIPIEYITGFTYFGNNKYIVKKNNCKVYIPSPDSIQIVHKVMNILQQITQQNMSKILLLDIGTGSGALLIESFIYSLLMLSKRKHKTQNLTWNLIGTDISKCALKIAHTNINNIIKKLHVAYPALADNMKNTGISTHILYKLLKLNIVYKISSRSNTIKSKYQIHPFIRKALQQAEIVIIIFNKPYIPKNMQGSLESTLAHYPKQALFQDRNTQLAWRHFINYLNKFHTNYPNKLIYIIQETSHNPKKKSIKFITRQIQ